MTKYMDDISIYFYFTYKYNEINGYHQYPYISIYQNVWKYMDNPFNNNNHKNNNQTYIYT
jgi:hypothetical protein